MLETQTPKFEITKNIRDEEILIPNILETETFFKVSLPNKVIIKKDPYCQ